MAAESKASSINAWLSVATGVLALATAALGFFSYSKSQQATDSRQQASVVSSSAASEQAGAAESISSLQSANQSLSSALASYQTQTSSSGTVTFPNPSPNTAGQVRHTDPFDLVNNGTSPDLDAPQSDPQWTGDFYTNDFFPASGKPPGMNPAFPEIRFVIVPSTAPSYDACHKATGYTHEVLSLADIKVGDLICVQTNQGRFSAMSVTGVTDTKVSFQVTTYEK